MGRRAGLTILAIILFASFAYTPHALAQDSEADLSILDNETLNVSFYEQNDRYNVRMISKKGEPPHRAGMTFIEAYRLAKTLETMDTVFADIEESSSRGVRVELRNSYVHFYKAEDGQDTVSFDMLGIQGDGMVLTRAEAAELAAALLAFDTRL